MTKIYLNFKVEKKLLMVMSSIFFAMIIFHILIIQQSTIDLVRADIVENRVVFNEFKKNSVIAGCPKRPKTTNRSMKFVRP